MGFIVSFLLKLDAAIQRRFNSVCFFLMSRFGVRKSTLRYMFIALVIVGLAAITVDLLRNHHPWLAFFLGIYLILLLIAQHVLWNIDRKAESGDTGAIGLLQNGTPGNRHNRRKAVSAVLLILTFFLSSDAYALTLMGARAFLIGRLLLLYIAKTPMNPPAEKAREHALSPLPATANT